MIASLNELLKERRMNFKMKVIAVLVPAIFLSACGKGEEKAMGSASVSVSSETATKTSTPVGEEIAQLEKLSDSKDIKNSISMPAIVALAPTLLGNLAGESGSSYRHALVNMSATKWAHFDEATACEAFSNYKGKDEEGARLKSLCASNSVEALAELKHIKAMNAVKVSALMAIAPNNGWEANPMSKNKAVINYMNNYEVAGCITNSVGGTLANAIGKVVMPDPKAIAARSDRLFKAIGDDAITKVVDDCIAKYPLNRNDRTVNLTGTTGAQWVAGSEQFAADSAGLVITSYGIDWYGKGNFSGRKYDIATSVGSGLSTDISLSTKKGSSTDTSQSTGSKAAVSTGN